MRSQVLKCQSAWQQEVEGHPEATIFPEGEWRGATTSSSLLLSILLPPMIEDGQVSGV